MRVAFVLTQSLESPSGLGRYFPLAKELAKFDYEIHIVALHHNYSSLIQQYWVQEGVHIHYVAQMHVKKEASEKYYFNPIQLFWVVFIATVQLTRALFRIKPDIVHIGKPQPMNSIASWVYSRLKGKPLYLDMDDYEAASNHFKGMWQRKIITWFEDSMPFQSNVITVNTYFTRDRLIKLGCLPQKIFYISNGVDRNRFARVDGTKVKNLKNKYHLDNKKVVLYIGSMSLVSHSVDLLINAFARVVKSVDNAVLVLVGGGEDHQFLIKLTKILNLGDRVIHIGKIASVEVPNYYCLADVTVDPTIDDDAHRGRCPLKIFESLTMGVPIVTGDVGDRRILLTPSFTNILVSPGNEESLATGILNILTNSNQSVVRQNKSDNIDDYFWDRLAIQFSILYEKYGTEHLH